MSSSKTQKEKNPFSRYEVVIFRFFARWPITLFVWPFSFHLGIETPKLIFITAIASGLDTYLSLRRDSRQPDLKTITAQLDGELDGPLPEKFSKSTFSIIIAGVVLLAVCLQLNASPLLVNFLMWFLGVFAVCVTAFFDQSILYARQYGIKPNEQGRTLIEKSRYLHLSAGLPSNWFIYFPVLYVPFYVFLVGLAVATSLSVDVPSTQYASIIIWVGLIFLLIGAIWLSEFWRYRAVALSMEFKKKEK